MSTKILAVLTIVSVSFSSFADEKDHVKERGGRDGKRAVIADKYPLYKNLGEELDRLDNDESFKLKIETEEAGTKKFEQVDIKKADAEKLTKLVTFAANYLEVQESCSDDSTTATTKELLDMCLAKDGLASVFLEYGTPPAWKERPGVKNSSSRIASVNTLGACWAQMISFIDRRAEVLGADAEKHSPADKIFKEQLISTFKILTNTEFDKEKFKGLDATVSPVKEIKEAGEKAISALKKENACKISLVTKKDREGKEEEVPGRKKRNPGDDEDTDSVKDEDRERRLKDNEGKTADAGNIREGLPQGTTAKNGGNGEEPPKDIGPKGPGEQVQGPTPFSPTPGLQTQADPGALAGLDNGLNGLLDQLLNGLDRNDNIIQPAVVTPPASNSGGDRSVSTPPEAPLPSITPPQITPPASTAKPEQQAQQPIPPMPNEPGNLGGFPQLPPERQATTETKENKEDPTAAALLSALNKLNQPAAVDPTAAAKAAVNDKLGQILPLLQQQSAANQQAGNGTRNVRDVLGGSGGFQRGSSTRNARNGGTVRTASRRSGNSSGRANIATVSRGQNTRVQSINGTGTPIRSNGLGQQPRSNAGLRGPLRK